MPDGGSDVPGGDGVSEGRESAACTTDVAATFSVDGGGSDARGGDGCVEGRESAAFTAATVGVVAPPRYLGIVRLPPLFLFVLLFNFFLFVLIILDRR